MYNERFAFSTNVGVEEREGESEQKMFETLRSLAIGFNLVLAFIFTRLWRWLCRNWMESNLDQVLYCLSWLSIFKKKIFRNFSFKILHHGFVRIFWKFELGFRRLGNRNNSSILESFNNLFYVILNLVLRPMPILKNSSWKFSRYQWFLIFEKFWKLFIIRLHLRFD